MTTVRLLRRQTDTRQSASLLSSSLSDSRVSKVTIQTAVPIRLADGSSRIGKWIFPYAPNDVSISGLSDAYDQLARPGRLPIVQRGARNPIQVDISSIVVRRNANSTAVDPIDDELLLLRRIARSNVNLIMGGKLLGRLHHGIRFRMTDFSVESVRRDPQQRLTIANVTLGLLQVHTDPGTVPGMIVVADLPPAARRPGASSASGPPPDPDATLTFPEHVLADPSGGPRTAYGVGE
jgi:hypothetical protein